MDPAELARRWLSYTEDPGTSNERHQDFPASKALSEMAIDDTISALDVIKEVLALGPSEEEKAVLAAGPFEDVLVHLVEPWTHERKDEVANLIWIFGRLVWPGRMPTETSVWFDAILRRS